MNTFERQCYYAYLGIPTKYHLLGYLKNYILSEDDCKRYGMPILHLGGVVYFSTSRHRNQSIQEWKQLVENYFNDPVPRSQIQKIHWIQDNSKSLMVNNSFAYVSALKRECAQCCKSYFVDADSGINITNEICQYHDGKLSNSYWTCCNRFAEEPGCRELKSHVWSGTVPGYNGPFTDYVMTKPSSNHTLPDVYALDCEMVYTKHGLELAKVTIVDLDCNIIYEEIVKPDSQIIHYNTRFSGLRAEDLDRAEKTLHDVQRDLLSFITAETILMGHGIENDLRSLKLVHTRVIDTSILFPHRQSRIYRRGLKELAQTELGLEIQTYEHDSLEDSKTVVKLVLHKLESDIKNLQNR